MGKIVAIMGGGDWADASVVHLVLPDSIDIEQEKQEWDQWYRCIYRNHIGKIKYKDFVEWLIEKGARETTEDEVLEYWKT